MSKRLEDLVPEVREKAERLLELAREAGCPIRITHTLRTYDEQAHLYAKGRSMPGSVVTNAPPGYSWHNFGRAFDVCFDKREDVYTGPWDQIGKLGESVGLEWGGRFKSLPDRPHFQHRPHGLTLALARQQHEMGLLA